MIDIISAEPADVLHVAQNLRLSDHVELSASSPEALPKHTVMESVFLSRWCMAVRVDGLPVILFGVCDTDQPGCGVPWMVCTDGAAAISRQFVRGCGYWVSRMQTDFPFLFNQVHRGNTLSINWLRWLGFTVDESSRVGNEGAFFNFWKGVPPCANQQPS